ncbi:hypothetical protein UA08_02564 [Talaromyces atroroseus]|uniref:F-box domain-containing protein n=1 Tax=Talaromyces atroroseus TaxID=1441469 RepID=A0A225AUD6_TALAT|nr:hypothetical protein UA08_02564 [Talaromyces atroroseus]OKL61974.1 hypothetical protein UA08_02564 [Talaromyces atroroseus]
MADLFARLPAELRHTIFSALSHEKSSLSNALVVNRSWNAQTVGFIWSEVTLREIWHIRNSQNAHNYLSFVRSLVFGLSDNRYHDDIIQACTQLRIPRLEKISFMPGIILRNDSIDYIVPYLQPSLLTFCSIGGKLSLKLLSALKDTCTRLEDLRFKMPLDSITDEVNADDFYCWLQEIPSLRALSFFNKGNVESSTVDAIMSQLFSKSTLERLLTRPFRRLCLEYRVDEPEEFDTSSICHSLRELSVIVRADVITALQDLGRLQMLQLRIDGDYPEDVLSPICSLAELKSLSIIFTTAGTLNTEQVMSLKHLDRLEKLEIRTSEKAARGFEGYVLKNVIPIKLLPSFDENDFDELASSLPKLRNVCLLFDWDPDGRRVLLSAASFWPNIESLYLGYNIDLYESILVSEKPLFPCLKNMSKIRFLFTDVTGNCDYNDSFLTTHIEKIVGNLSHALPVLKDIEISGDPSGQLTIPIMVHNLWFPGDSTWSWNNHRLDWCWEFEGYL